MNEVRNEEFEEALANEDNIKILNHVCKRYTNQISPEDLYTCKLIALWEAIRNFNPEKKVKFTSFLYNWIGWECKRQISRYQKDRRLSTNRYFDKNSTDPNRCEFLDFIDSLPKKLATVLKQRYLYGYTVQEIAERNHYSRETARQYIKKGVQKLKSRYS